MRGAGLLAWARGEVSRWFDARHDPKREPLEHVIAAAYVRGGIDALKQETERIRHEDQYTRDARADARADCGCLS